MKKLLLTAGGFIAAASAAVAGGLADAVMETEIIEVAPERGGSLPGWVIPLAIVGIVIAIASSSDDDDSCD